MVILVKQHSSQPFTLWYMCVHAHHLILVGHLSGRMWIHQKETYWGCYHSRRNHNYHPIQDMYLHAHYNECHLLKEQME